MRNAILSIAVLLIACTLRAQEGASVTAAQHQNQAAMLLLNSEPAEAISSLQAAAALYKRDADWEHYFSCLNQVTEAYLELGRLEDAKRWAKKALWESIEKLGRDNNEAARAAHKLGEAYSSAGRHESALESHRLGLMIRRKLYGGRHPNWPILMTGSPGPMPLWECMIRPKIISSAHGRCGNPFSAPSMRK